MLNIGGPWFSFALTSVWSLVVAWLCWVLFAVLFAQVLTPHRSDGRRDRAAMLTAVVHLCADGHTGALRVAQLQYWPRPFGWLAIVTLWPTWLFAVATRARELSS